MSIPKKILNYLKKNDIEVKIEGHKKVYSAYDLARTLDEKLDKIGKSLLVKVDGKPYLVLIPGHYHLDLGKIKRELKAKRVEIADEKHVKKVLDSKLGALHPFKGLHKVEVLLDKALLKSKEAIVGAGSFTESLRMKTRDLHKLEDATVGDFGKMAVKTAKSAPKKVKKAVKSAKKGIKKTKSAVKKASSSKQGKAVKKAIKKTTKKAMKTKAGKKVKRAVKKIEKKSPIKVKISKKPAIKRKRK